MKRRCIQGLALVAISCAGIAGSAQLAGAAEGTGALPERKLGTWPFAYPLRQAPECAEICVGDREPVVSPDGRRVAFMYSPPRAPHGSSHFDLMVMNPDGGGRRVLATGFGFVRHPLWSPDGRTLLFPCGGGPSRGFVPYWLCTVDANGQLQEPRTLITPPAYTADFPQDWSPDGGRVAFERVAGNSYSLYTARSDGSDLVSLGGGPEDSLNYLDAAWSRDGQQLAFVTDTRTTNSTENLWKLWVADGEGQGRRLVVSTLDGLSILAWAPDGRSIYLGRYENAGAPLSWISIVRVDLASGDLKTLVKRRTGVLGAAWLSPDGQTLAFVQGRLITLADTSERNVRVIARGASSQARQLAYGPGATTFDWSADSKRLIYVSDGDCPALLGMYSIDVKTRRTHRLTNPCRIVGSARADALVGTKATNAMYGRGGSDRIEAGARPDYVDGGRGEDLVDGGPGDDRLYGGPGEDRIFGGRGWDAIVAVDRVMDRIVCGSGRDIVWADRGDEVARECEHVIRR